MGDNEINNNYVISTIKKRRSIRAYKEKGISEEILKTILEAGQYAPSGGNSQSSHLIVIQNKDILEKLKALVQNEFAKMELEENLYKSLKATISKSKAGSYDFIYNAPVLVVLCNQKGYGNAIADCSCAIENMMLAATSLGVGSCYINQLHWLDSNKEIRSFMNNLGVRDDETICNSLALGYSDSSELPPLNRAGNKITYIK